MSEKADSIKSLKMKKLQKERSLTQNLWKDTPRCYGKVLLFIEEDFVGVLENISSRPEVDIACDYFCKYLFEAFGNWVNVLLQSDAKIKSENLQI